MHRLSCFAKARPRSFGSKNRQKRFENKFPSIGKVDYLSNMPEFAS